jgi:hypothetical protein
MLEEAGEENLPTIINTMRIKFPDLTYEELLVSVRDAVRGLERRGLLYLRLATDADQTTVVELTVAGRECLRE